MELEGVTREVSNMGEPSLKNPLPKVKMKLLDKDYLCVIDTGSCVSIVCSNVIAANKLQNYNGPLLKFVTGDLLQVIGQVNLLLDERFEHSFVVVKEFRFDVLLGLDFLKKFDARININKNLVLGNAGFNFINKDDPKVRV